MKKTLISLLLLTACEKTPPADIKSQPVENPAMKFTQGISPLGKCEVWDDTSVLCRPTTTNIYWCEAKKSEKPHCEVAIDWTPPPPPSAEQPAASAKHPTSENAAPNKKK